ncbi:MAG: GHKL domain-containing protein [Clostridiales bacterium]|nr:GHKL domain-containing protein [Clostridiales bacterium]
MKKENLFFLLIPVSQVLILSGSILQRHPLNFWGYAGILLSVISDGILLFLLFWSGERERLQKELEKISQAQEIERLRNETLETNQEKLLEMQRGFEEELSMIRVYIDQGERRTAEEKLEQFQHELDSTRPASWCQNRIVNAIMSEKEKTCTSLGIELCANLMVPRTLKLEEFHLCSLFFNLLDNAIEAVQNLEENRRRIEVDAGIRGKYLFIKVRNPSEESHAHRKRRRGRGYGTQILEDLARRYEGSFVTSYDGRYFQSALSVKAL